MLHTKLQASLNQVLLKKKLFDYFTTYYYGLNLGPPHVGPSWIWGRSFEQTW